MSSSTACSAPTPITASRSIPAHRSTSPAARPAARPRRSPPRCATSRSAATPAARSACRPRSPASMAFARPSAASTLTGATPMAPSYDTIGFLAREAELFRNIGHVLLGGAKVETPVKRLIIARGCFRLRREQHRRRSVAGFLAHRRRVTAGRAENPRRRGYRQLARCLPRHPGLRDPVDAASLCSVP